MYINIVYSYHLEEEYILAREESALRLLVHVVKYVCGKSHAFKM